MSQWHWAKIAICAGESLDIHLLKGLFFNLLFWKDHQSFSKGLSSQKKLLVDGYHSTPLPLNSLRFTTGLSGTLPVGHLQRIGLRQQKLHIIRRQKVSPCTRSLHGRSSDTQPNGDLTHTTRSWGLLRSFRLHPWIQWSQTTMSVTQLQLGVIPQLLALQAASLVQSVIRLSRTVEFTFSKPTLLSQQQPSWCLLPRIASLLPTRGMSYVRRKKNGISKELLKIREKKLLLAQKKQLIDEKNQILVKKNPIVAEKKQIVDKEQQQPETQVNDMKMLSQNKDLED
jgi:hypothetical protein